jgi:hypothetical protein
MQKEIETDGQTGLNTGGQTQEYTDSKVTDISCEWCKGKSRGIIMVIARYWTSIQKERGNPVETSLRIDPEGPRKSSRNLTEDSFSANRSNNPGSPSY